MTHQEVLMNKEIACLQRVLEPSLARGRANPNICLNRKNTARMCEDVWQPE